MHSFLRAIIASNRAAEAGDSIPQPAELTKCTWTAIPELYWSAAHARRIHHRPNIYGVNKLKLSTPRTVQASGRAIDGHIFTSGGGVQRALFVPYSTFNEETRALTNCQHCTGERLQGNNTAGFSTASLGTIAKSTIKLSDELQFKLKDAV